jgi:hypothetical protein
VSDQEVRLQAVLDDLENDRISTADAAARVRALRLAEPPPRTISQRMADSAENDMPRLPQEGSFFAVSKALHAGKISFRQYEALAEAAASGVDSGKPNALFSGHGEDAGSGAWPQPGGASGLLLQR